jgi:protoheme IX farnesyltransferase
MNALSEVTSVEPPLRHWRHYVELTKPRINVFCLLMTLGGLALAPHAMPLWKVLATLLGTGFSVGAANALNMYWERETDKLMKRTAQRPLASGRISAHGALLFAILLAIASVLILGLWVNWLTSALSVFALLSYAFVYTPLKRVTPHALLIGAVPGAMPPLLGWTAATNSISAPGMILFGILLLWQIPHFIAISVNHERDYKNAGIKTWPGDRGLRPATMQAVLYSLALLPVSVLLMPIGTAGILYTTTATALGIWMTVASLRGFAPEKHKKWAKQLFFASLVYLPVLTLGLAVDVLLK